MELDAGLCIACRFNLCHFKLSIDLLDYNDAAAGRFLLLLVTVPHVRLDHIKCPTSFFRCNLKKISSTIVDKVVVVVAVVDDDGGGGGGVIYERIFLIRKPWQIPHLRNIPKNIMQYYTSRWILKYAVWGEVRTTKRGASWYDTNQDRMVRLLFKSYDKYL